MKCKECKEQLNTIEKQIYKDTCGACIIIAENKED